MPENQNKTSDSRELFAEKPIDMDAVRVGDWIRCSSWSRPRQVLVCEQDTFVVLAEPDTARQDEYNNRKVTKVEWLQRGLWTVMPGMRSLWTDAGREIEKP